MSRRKASSCRLYSKLEGRVEGYPIGNSIADLFVVSKRSFVALPCGCFGFAEGHAFQSVDAVNDGGEDQNLVPCVRSE